LNISTIKENKKNILFASVIFFLTSVISIFLVDAYFLNLKKDNWVCEICQFDSEFGWYNIPNKNLSKNNITYTTNSMGFRSPEIDPTKDHIVILGDSVAIGKGVSDDETVSYYLQQETPEYQVITLAVTGHSIDQYYLNLKKHIKKLNPKFIVPIIFSGNDWPETLKDEMWQIDKPFFTMENGDLKRENPNLSMFSCWNYFAASWFFSHFNHQDLKNFLCGGSKLNETDGRKLVDKLFKKINEIGTSHGAKTMFVLSPTFYDFFEEACSPGSMGQFCKANQKYFSEFLKKEYLKLKKDSPDNISKLFSLTSRTGFRHNYLKLKEIFDSGKYPLIDLFNFYKNERYKMGTIYLPTDLVHFSKHGNSVLAKLIAKNMKLELNENSLNP
jgi:hypothetical protein